MYRNSAEYFCSQNIENNHENLNALKHAIDLVIIKTVTQLNDLTIDVKKNNIFTFTFFIFY